MPNGIPEFMAGLRGGLTGDTRTGLPRGARRAGARGKAGASPVVRALFVLGLLVVIAASAVVAIAWAWGLDWRKLPFAPKDPDAPHIVSAAPEEAADDLKDILATDPGVTPRKWTALVFHHSATSAGGAESFGAYHRQEKGWQSLAYHFVIGNGTATPDGSIETGPRWRRQEAGAHAHSAEFNEQGIGICLVGNFELQPPTPAQVSAARALARELCRRFQIPPDRILGHNQIREGGGTACPGKLFPLDDLRRESAAP
jgi:hypothetical protein